MVSRIVRIFLNKQVKHLRSRSRLQQVAQLSQRDRTAGCVSFGQK